MFMRCQLRLTSSVMVTLPHCRSWTYGTYGIAVEATYPQEMWTSRTGSLPQMAPNFGPNVCVVLLNDVMPDLIWLKNLRILRTSEWSPCFGLRFLIPTYPNTTRTKNLYTWLGTGKLHMASGARDAVTCEAINGIKYSEGFNGADGAKLSPKKAVPNWQLGSAGWI